MHDSHKLVKHVVRENRQVAGHNFLVKWAPGPESPTTATRKQQIELSLKKKKRKDANVNLRKNKAEDMSAVR